MKLLKTNDRNQMKMQNSVTFVEKCLKINMLKIKNFAKLEIIVVTQANI